MSRPYVISLSETVTREIVADDGVECTLSILNVLPAEQMQPILEQELTRRGFQQEAGSWTRTSETGIRVEVNAASRKVSITKKAQKTLTVTGSGSVHGDTDDRSDVREKHLQEAAQRAQENANKQLEALREKERAAITAELRAGIEPLTKELDQIALRVTQEALTTKARTLGDVVSQREDPETGSMVIRVRL